MMRPWIAIVDCGIGRLPRHEVAFGAGGRDATEGLVVAEEHDVDAVARRIAGERQRLQDGIGVLEVGQRRARITELQVGAQHEVA
jgi:hypothetical protein